LVELQKKNKPYAGFNIKSPKKYEYMFASPGPIYEPGEKGDFWNMASCLYASGLRKGDLVYNTFSYHLGPAGIMMGNSAIDIGCSVIPAGVGNTDLQILTIEALNPDFYIGTPSFLKIILDKISLNKMNIPKLKNALVGAEPFPNQLRKYFKDKYKIVPLQMYGTAELGCIAFETKDINKNVNDGMILEENIILEIVKPGSNELAGKGEVGEVVVTKLDNTYPMIRLATGDLTAVIEEPSPCGRTNVRIKGWMGRAEQSTKVKGLFITPEQIHKITIRYKEVIKARLVIYTKDYLDDPILFCEIENKSSNLDEEVRSFFKSQFKLNVKIKLVNKGEIANDGIIIEDKRSQD
jgi:phenylacetate-CoA ligase